jgi:hypothetical protein
LFPDDTTSNVSFGARGATPPPVFFFISGLLRYERGLSIMADSRMEGRSGVFFFFSLFE